MTTTSPSFTKEIRRNRETKDYDMLLDGQYIGSRSTYHQAEIDLDQHVFELLSSDLVIPATTLDGICGDCGQTLDSMGLCGCQTEQEPTRDTLGYCTGCGAPPEKPCMCSATIKAITETPRHTIFCVCSAAGVILTPEGAFCGACFEAAGLWQLWKTDSTAFVWMLRQQQARLNEMAARLATYLSRKHNAHLSCDSILTMWRQLLDDGEPPEPRYYVVAARQQVAA